MKKIYKILEKIGYIMADYDQVQEYSDPEYYSDEETNSGIDADDSYLYNYNCGQSESSDAEDIDYAKLRETEKQLREMRKRKEESERAEKEKQEQMRKQREIERAQEEKRLDESRKRAQVLLEKKERDEKMAAVIAWEKEQKRENRKAVKVEKAEVKAEAETKKTTNDAWDDDKPVKPVRRGIRTLGALKPVVPKPKAFRTLAPLPQLAPVKVVEQPTEQPTETLEERYAKMKACQKKKEAEERAEKKKKAAKRAARKARMFKADQLLDLKKEGINRNDHPKGMYVIRTVKKWDITEDHPLWGVKDTRLLTERVWCSWAGLDKDQKIVAMVKYREEQRQAERKAAIEKKLAENVNKRKLVMRSSTVFHKKQTRHSRILPQVQLVSDAESDSDEAKEMEQHMVETVSIVNKSLKKKEAEKKAAEQELIEEEKERKAELEFARTMAPSLGITFDEDCEGDDEGEGRELTKAEKKKIRYDKKRNIYKAKKKLQKEQTKKMFKPLTHQEGGKKRWRGKNIAKELYRTSICRSALAGRQCNYKGCTYAHTPEEWRPRICGAWDVNADISEYKGCRLVSCSDDFVYTPTKIRKKKCGLHPHETIRNYCERSEIKYNPVYEKAKPVTIDWVRDKKKTKTDVMVFNAATVVSVSEYGSWAKMLGSNATQKKMIAKKNWEKVLKQIDTDVWQCGSNGITHMARKQMMKEEEYKLKWVAVFSQITERRIEEDVDEAVEEVVEEAVEEKTVMTLDEMKEMVEIMTVMKTVMNELVNTRVEKENDDEEVKLRYPDEMAICACSELAWIDEMCEHGTCPRCLQECKECKEGKEGEKYILKTIKVEMPKYKRAWGPPMTNHNEMIRAATKTAQKITERISRERLYEAAEAKRLAIKVSRNVHIRIAHLQMAKKVKHQRWLRRQRLKVTHKNALEVGVIVQVDAGLAMINEVLEFPHGMEVRRSKLGKQIIFRTSRENFAKLMLIAASHTEDVGIV